LAEAETLAEVETLYEGEYAEEEFAEQKKYKLQILQLLHLQPRRL
jgi:hypothetical protein